MRRKLHHGLHLSCRRDDYRIPSSAGTSASLKELRAEIDSLEAMNEADFVLPPGKFGAMTEQQLQKLELELEFIPRLRLHALKDLLIKILKQEVSRVLLEDTIFPADEEEDRQRKMAEVD